MKKIIITEDEKKLIRGMYNTIIKEQWWLDFINAASSEGPGLGWGPDINLGGNMGDNPKIVKEIDVEISKVENLMKKANAKKNNINTRCSKYLNVHKPTANAGEIQDFLISFGHSITKDWSFGDSTATAVGTYFYGTSAGINSVYKLWNKLKTDGWDVGTTPGFGIKMGTAISTIISKIVNKKQSGCKTDLDKINGVIKEINGINTRLNDMRSKYAKKYPNQGTIYA